MNLYADRFVCPTDTVAHGGQTVKGGLRMGRFQLQVVAECESARSGVRRLDIPASVKHLGKDIGMAADSLELSAHHAERHDGLPLLEEQCGICWSMVRFGGEVR